MSKHGTLVSLAVGAALTLAFMGCEKQGSMTGPTPLGLAAGGAAVNANETRIAPPFSASNFTAGVANPYFPLTPGLFLIYRQDTPDGVEIDTVEVTHDTKGILGVTTTVVHDRVYLNGALSEDTFDWYAADNDGNVWYFGEDTRTVGPPVSTTGSWEAGQAGALPGLIMLAHPMVGDVYQQENAPGVVADEARVKGLDETITVPYGTFTGCIKTQEWTPIEPGSRAFKYYASGVGTVLEAENKKGGPVELTAVIRP